MAQTGFGCARRKPDAEERAGELRICHFRSQPAVVKEARCFAGNFLFSTGPNSQGGGKRTTKGHYDVPMRDCTVTLDNDVIIERGKIADDKMRVMRVAR